MCRVNVFLFLMWASTVYPLWYKAGCVGCGRQANKSGLFRQTVSAETAAWHTTPVWRLNGALFYWLTDSLRSLPISLLSSQQNHFRVSWLDSVLTLSPTTNLNRRTIQGEVGSEMGGDSCTFNSSPLGLPPQQPPAIDLVLLVAAHHSKWDHLLLTGQRSTDNGVRNYST